jgi:hypothetical protein
MTAKRSPYALRVARHSPAGQVSPKGPAGSTYGYYFDDTYSGCERTSSRLHSEAIADVAALQLPTVYITY